MYAHDDLRIVVLIRNTNAREFVLFEEEAQRFVPSEYEWSYNRDRNLQAHDKQSKKHRFTWQFSGSQFTVIREVPASARRFKIIPDIPMVSPDEILDYLGFSEDWIGIVE